MLLLSTAHVCLSALSPAAAIALTAVTAGATDGDVQVTAPWACEEWVIVGWLQRALAGAMCGAPLSKGTSKEESTPGTWIAETLMALSRDMLDLIFTWWSREAQSQGGIANNIGTTNTTGGQHNNRHIVGLPEQQAMPGSAALQLGQSFLLKLGTCLGYSTIPTPQQHRLPNV
jgi:hypothetical protein